MNSIILWLETLLFTIRIEQDPDIVMFIYRDDLYNQESERKNIADIIIAKHRNGPVGEISLYFQASQTRFRDLELNTSAE